MELVETAVSASGGRSIFGLVAQTVAMVEMEGMRLLWLVLAYWTWV